LDDSVRLRRPGEFHPEQFTLSLETGTSRAGLASYRLVHSAGYHFSTRLQTSIRSEAENPTLSAPDGFPAGRPLNRLRP